MIKNYLKIAYRNLLRNKLFTLVNIFGLAIGMAACFLIVQYVRFELSYDKFHEEHDRIYRVIIDADKESSATNHPGAGPALKQDFPEVQEYARIVHQSIFMGNSSTWAYVDEKGEMKSFNEDRVYCADPSFITMFSFPFVYGDPQQALADNSSIVISQSISRKFFGNENPLGKTLLLGGERPFTVTGVFKDVPENSHVKFDILVSFFLRDGWNGGWNHEWDWKWAEFFTYVQLDPQTDPSKLQAKFPALVEKFSGERMKERNKKYRFVLQPITDIHLKSPNLAKEQEVHGRESTVYFLSVIAFLILIIAWINYINLSTSKSLDRAQEVGLRKVVGASKRQLVTQFLFESVLVNILALVLSILFVILMFPYFNQLVGKNVGDFVLEFTILNESFFWVALIGIFVLGAFLAGLYPAFVLSSFKIVSVLKGKFFGSRSGVMLRKALVGFQFAISVALLAGTIAVLKQVSFMRKQDLGYIKDQLLVVKTPQVGDSTLHNRMQSFKTELGRNSNIKSLAPTSEIPGRQISQLNFIRNFDDGNENGFLCYHFWIDKDFVTTYGLNVVAGRNFNEQEQMLFQEERENTAMPIMLNEKAIRQLGYKDPQAAVDKLIKFGLGPRDWVGKIVGVIQDHHQRSLKDDYDPIIFFPSRDFFGEYLTINMSMQDASETISFVEGQFKQTFPGNVFEYFFLDAFFDRQYAADNQFGKVFGLFSGLALLVAALGLFGLSTFMISQRTKEIAIRKVLGATIQSMIYLFSSDFMKLILVANVIALPIAYWFISRWLDSFAFRDEIGWIMFVMPAAILLIISLVTVSIQTIKTGITNPVKALKSE
jgi:putative ABC transport system permease protein